MRLTTEELREAREWLADIEWSDLDSDDFRVFLDEQVEKAIERHWDGGIEDFKRCQSPSR